MSELTKRKIGLVLKIERIKADLSWDEMEHEAGRDSIVTCRHRYRHPSAEVKLELLDGGWISLDVSAE